VKIDKIDAAVLAKLHPSGFLPEVWMPDEEIETHRRVVEIDSRGSRIQSRREICRARIA
jgi:hypothetical protein